MVRLSLLALLVACKGGSLDYGTKPHLLGKLDGFDFKQAPAQLDADGKLSYRVKASTTGVATATVAVEGSIDDLVAAWGKGIPTKSAGGHVYTDGKTRFDVRPAGAGFEITAQPIRAFDAVVDDGTDVKVFGVDVIGRPMADVATDLAKHGVDVHRTPDAMNGAWMAADDPPATDLGPVGFSMRAQGDPLAVVSYSLRFSTHEVDNGQATVFARLVKKWGQPDEMGPNIRFHGDHPFISGDRKNDDVDIVVDN